MLCLCNWRFICPANIRRHCDVCWDAVVTGLVAVPPVLLSTMVMVNMDR